MSSVCVITVKRHLWELMLEAVACGYEAFTSVSGNGFPVLLPSLAGYVSAATNSSTHYGEYDDTIEKDCDGNLSSSGSAFGSC